MLEYFMAVDQCWPEMARGLLKCGWSKSKTWDVTKNLRYYLNIFILIACENSSNLDILG